MDQMSKFGSGAGNTGTVRKRMYKHGGEEVKDGEDPDMDEEMTPMSPPSERKGGRRRKSRKSRKGRKTRKGRRRRY